MTRVTCTLVTILLIHVTHVSNDPAKHVTSDTESEYYVVSNNKSSLASSECCYNYHVCLCLISGDTPDSQPPDTRLSLLSVSSAAFQGFTVHCWLCVFCQAFCHLDTTQLSHNIHSPLTTYFL